ncbi:DNA alkylation repair protein [Sporolactobacillus pectinivorans]|uniref:DNA alkylation repair protein n=1 Tax=Sporolactobacillus pectinivorans TaxID=1591408 RepID=UPI001EFC916E|nr:DNA alkylation repair protein [Sporolactobacillus pectinivorans]
MTYNDAFVEKIKHEKVSFKEIEKMSKLLVKNLSIDQCDEMAENLYSSSHYQVRELSVFTLGLISSQMEKALNYLKKNVSLDENWRVQEILAKAFDIYCHNQGYEKSLPIINSWLADENPNVRRAVTEGLRIWTNREYFKQNPEQAICLLSNLKYDESEYVRKSVGNALKDISKKHKELVISELSKWELNQKSINQVYKFATKYINNKG